MTASKTCLSIATAVVVIASGLALDVNAATASRSPVSTAANACLPAFGPSEVAIRKRPLTVQNEGSTNAFVTCSFVSQGAPTTAYVYVNSFDGAAHDISCTGVTSYLTGPNLYVTKTVTAGPGTDQELLQWLPADFSGTTSLPSAYFSVSCSLLPGTGVNDVGINYNEEIGT